MKDQVDWYIQRYDINTSSGEYIGAAGSMTSTTNARIGFAFRKEMRTTPSWTSSAAATFEVTADGAAADLSGISTSTLSKLSHGINCTRASTTAGFGASLARDGSDATYLQYNARH